jgi:hypothetical protein
MVLYYELPKLSDSTKITMEIKDSKGNLVRQFSSEKDKDYIPHNGGGAPPAPVLPKNEGLNRFVWDMGHSIVPGIPGVYIEANFRGHDAIPGTYTMTLKADGEAVTTQGDIKPIPTIEMKPGQFEEYDVLMSEMEQKITEMHTMVNTLFKVQNKLKSVLTDLEEEALKSKGEALLEKMKAWDADMVQRKSQAYDDVENFPNKFTAEYLFLLNQTSGSIPRVNKSNLDRKQELDKQWIPLKARGEALLNTDIPAYNKALWEAGIGALNPK